MASTVAKSKKAMSNIPTVDFIWKGEKLIRFDLSRKTWLTMVLVMVGAAACITHGGMLISESQTMQQGKGVVYDSPFGKRIRFKYDEFPDRMYDAPSPDATMAAGTEVKVWTNGSTPWTIRSIRDAPIGSGEVSYMGVIHILVAILLLFWFLVNTKNKRVP